MNGIYQFGGVVGIFVTLAHFMFQLLHLELLIVHVFHELRLLRVSFADFTITAFQQCLLCIQLLLYFLQASLHNTIRQKAHSS